MADLSPEAAEALAKRRYFTIQAVRLAGIALLLGAIWLRHGEGEAPGGAPLVLALSGGVLLAVVPRLLARRWRSGGG